MAEIIFFYRINFYRVIITYRSIMTIIIDQYPVVYVGRPRLVVGKTTIIQTRMNICLFITHNWGSDFLAINASFDGSVIER